MATAASARNGLTEEQLERIVAFMREFGKAVAKAAEEIAAAVLEVVDAVGRFARSLDWLWPHMVAGAEYMPGVGWVGPPVLGWRFVPPYLRN